MTDRTPKPLEQYLHFKGGRYQVLCLAEKEDTGERLVIYQALYGEGRIYARNLESFTSAVDPAKYPSAGQYWRFLRVLPPETDGPADAARNEGPVGSVRQPADAAEAAGPYRQEEDFRPKGPATCQRESVPDSEEEGICQRGPSSVVGEKGAYRSESVFGPEEKEPVFGDELPEEGEELVLDPAVERFLDAETIDQKLDALTMARDRITDDMIDIMAASAGLEIEPGPVRERYEDLKGCLITIGRYELDRSRFRS